MHIVYLIHQFPISGNSTGGAGNYVLNMAKTMKKFGNKVTIVCEASKKKIFEWDGIEIHNINATKGFHDTGRPMQTYKKVLKNICRSFWYNYEVYRINRQTHVDIVQSVSTYGLALLRIEKIPYVIRVSEYPALWSGANKIEFDFNSCINSHRADEELSFKALVKAEQIIVPSSLMSKLIFRKIGKTPIVIEGPIILPEENEDFKEKELITEKYWVTYGAMIYRKGIHILAQIIDRLLENYPDMKYVMIGKDREINFKGNFIKASEFFDRFIKKNKDRFLFLDEISDRTRLFTIIRNAHSCILPTRIDNLPNTCLEAMALKKIVISSTSDYGTSVEQLIVDGYNGFLSNVDDVESLYKKIVSVMQLSKEKKTIIEKRASERVENLTSENVYIKMMKVYQDTINRHSKLYKKR